MPRKTANAAHPLVDAVDELGVQVVAKAVGVDRTTVQNYLAKARKSKDAKVPPHWVMPLVKLTKIPAKTWRPDVFV